MKYIYPIFIIVFVFLSLFVVKDDVKPVYNKAVIYVKSFLNNNFQTNLNIENKKDLVSLETTPGPLRVLNKILSSEKKETLSAKTIKRKF